MQHDDDAGHLGDRRQATHGVTDDRLAGQQQELLGLALGQPHAPALAGGRDDHPCLRPGRATAPVLFGVGLTPSPPSQLIMPAESRRTLVTRTCDAGRRRAAIPNIVPGRDAPTPCPRVRPRSVDDLDARGRAATAPSRGRPRLRRRGRPRARSWASRCAASRPRRPRRERRRGRRWRRLRSCRERT